MPDDKREVCSAEAYEVQASNRYRIPTSSGIELGATITRPTASGKFPALMWYDPYRSGSDGEASSMARYFVRRGYVFVNLNVRGTGNSQGVSTDEYTVEETQDGCDAIAWLAGQSWSTGRMGMLGASYSGFNALQVAAAAPPALKAIAPAYFTDRRYTDDCHYKGGCLRGYFDMLTYGLGMVARNALPPFREAVGEAWSDLWQQRLKESEPYLLKWIQHQVEDDYWSVGSIAGHTHNIQAATFIIGGWNDGYLNPPLRVFQELQAPKKLLMGPWKHAYPNSSHCGPRIDIHFELLRWWDHWLKDMDNGVPDEPPVQVYEREYEPPITDRTTIAGRWRAADALPRNEPPVYHLSGDTLSDRPSDRAGSAFVRYLPAACRNGGLWDAGVPFTLPGEQTEDSGHAINFTTQPLEADLPIFGNPTFSLYLSADVDVIPVAVRLLEVAPDNTGVLVTKGILNTTRRNGMNNPEPLTPGKITKVEYHLEATAWRFSRGSRIRISVNGSDFPHDVLEDRYRFVLNQDAGEMGVSHRDPARAWARAKREATVAWPGAEIRSEATGSLTSDDRNFTMNLALNVTLNNSLYFQKHWSCTTPRVLL